MKEDPMWISQDMIWREDGKVYILDDPATQYNFIYVYTILVPDFDPPSGTTFDADYELNVKRPTITITYYEEVTLTAATLNGVSIVGDITTTDQKVYTYTPSSDLAAGSYTLSVTAEDAEGNEDVSTSSYTISIPAAEPEFPWLIVIIVIIIIIILLVLVLFKTGYLYVEEKPKK